LSTAGKKGDKITIHGREERKPEGISETKTLYGGRLIRDKKAPTWNQAIPGRNNNDLFWVCVPRQKATHQTQRERE